MSKSMDIKLFKDMKMNDNSISLNGLYSLESFETRFTGAAEESPGLSGGTGIKLIPVIKCFLHTLIPLRVHFFTIFDPLCIVFMFFLV